MRSVTDVSNAMNDVRSAGSWASTPPNSDAYTTLSAIEPDWSTAMMTSRARLRWRRPCPTSRSGTTVRCSGIVLQVGGDRRRPVDVAGARPPGARRPRERAPHRLAGLVGEPPLEVVEHLGDDLAGGRPGLVGQEPVELDEQRDEVDVGLDALEQLGFEQQLTQIEPVDRRRAGGSAPPASGSSGGCRRATGPRRVRAAEPAGAAAAAPRCRPSRCRDVAVVQRPERGVDADVIAVRPAVAVACVATRTDVVTAVRSRIAFAPGASSEAGPSSIRHAAATLGLDTCSSRLVTGLAASTPVTIGARRPGAEQVAHGDDRGGGTARVDVGAEPSRCGRRRRPTSTPELAALGRLERAERAAQRARSIASNASRGSDDTQPSSTPSRSASCTSTVPDPARNPSTNAAPLRRGRPARQRLRQTALHDVRPTRRRRRAAAGWRGPATRPCPAPVVSATSDRPAARRGGPDGRQGERTLERAEPFDHRCGRVVVERPGGRAAARRGSARRCRRRRGGAMSASVPRTSP